MPTYRQPNLPKGVRLSTEEYNQALLKFPKYCTNVVVLDTKRPGFWLPERADRKTPAGVWFIGGQVEVFMEEKSSLAKVFKRETGLDIHQDLFRLETNNRYWFDGSDGSVPHDAVCNIYSIELTEAERNAIRLDPEEYRTEKLSFYGCQEIAQIDSPMTRAIFLDLWKLFFVD